MAEQPLKIREQHRPTHKFWWIGICPWESVAHIFVSSPRRSHYSQARLAQTPSHSKHSSFHLDSWQPTQLCWIYSSLLTPFLTAVSPKLFSGEHLPVIRRVCLPSWHREAHRRMWKTLWMGVWISIAAGSVRRPHDLLCEITWSWPSSPVSVLPTLSTF